MKRAKLTIEEEADLEGRKARSAWRKREKFWSHDQNAREEVVVRRGWTHACDTEELYFCVSEDEWRSACCWVVIFLEVGVVVVFCGGGYGSGLVCDVVLGVIGCAGRVVCHVVCRIGTKNRDNATMARVSLCDVKREKQTHGMTSTEAMAGSIYGWSRDEARLWVKKR